MTTLESFGDDTDELKFEKEHIAKIKLLTADKVN